MLITKYYRKKLDLEYILKSYFKLSSNTNQWNKYWISDGSYKNLKSEVNFLEYLIS